MTRGERENELDCGEENLTPCTRKTWATCWEKGGQDWRERREATGKSLLQDTARHCKTLRDKTLVVREMVVSLFSFSLCPTCESERNFSLMTIDDL